MDANRAEMKLSDGSCLFIDVIAVENAFADNMYQRSEPDELICNGPVAYGDLVLNIDAAQYLKNVTQYKPFENYETDPS